MPTTSDMDLEGMVGDASGACVIADSDIQEEDGDHNDDDDEDILPLSGSTTLKPVRFWGDQSKTDALEPGIKLLSAKQVGVEDEDSLIQSKLEGQRATSNQVSRLIYGFRVRKWYS